MTNKEIIKILQYSKLDKELVNLISNKLNSLSEYETEYAEIVKKHINNLNEAKEHYSIRYEKIYSDIKESLDFKRFQFHDSEIINMLSCLKTDIDNLSIENISLFKHKWSKKDKRFKKCIFNNLFYLK